MNRPILAFAFLAIASATLAAQDANQTTPYQGTSNPPPDTTIETSQPQDAPAPTPKPKPRAGHPVTMVQPDPSQQPVPAQPGQATEPDDATADQPVAQPAPRPVNPARAYVAPAAVSAPQPRAASRADVDGTDDGIVQVGPETQGPPPLASRSVQPSADQPTAAGNDDDIVHPEPLPPGTLSEGATIRVHLLDRLSSSGSEKGEPFRSQVANDVWQGGQVLIPAGSEIDGVVADVSTGHFGGHGSLRLRPQTVKLADGTTFQLHAYVQGAPGTNARVGAEGEIGPGSRVKRDSIEYGGVVGGGVVTGAILGGPAGALAGGIIGAGVVTAHLLINHPQANLEAGTTLILTLSEPMQLTPAAAPGN